MYYDSCFNKRDRLVLFCYICWEICNLIAIQYAFFFCSFQTRCLIMYLAVCVNTLVMLHFYYHYGRKQRKSRNNLLALGLAVTWAADFFLTLHNRILPGFFLFCLVESIYALYLANLPLTRAKDPRRTLIGIGCLVLVCLMAFCAAGKMGLLTPEHALGILNLTLLTFNLLRAWFACSRDRRPDRLLLALGFTFIAGCDYSILVMFLSRGRVYDAAAFMIWIFYVPSQVFLVAAYALGCFSDI